MTKALITIDGETVSVEGLTLPSREFRDAWLKPVNGVVALDPAKVKEIMIKKVKAEAQRRILALTGNSPDQLLQAYAKQLNANMRATELTRKEINGGLSPAETIEANALQALADKIKNIRTKSNLLEGYAVIPEDFADDSHWAE